MYYLFTTCNILVVTVRYVIAHLFESMGQKLFQ